MSVPKYDDFFNPFKLQELILIKPQLTVLFFVCDFFIFIPNFSNAFPCTEEDCKMLPPTLFQHYL